MVEMKSEIQELVEQLGGSDILDDFLRLLIDVRAKSQAASAPAPPMPMHMMPPPPHMGGHHNQGPAMFVIDPMTGMPMPYGMFHHHAPPPPQPPSPRNGGNMVLSLSNEPTAVQKLKEREARRKELLETYTQQLKSLVAKSAADPAQAGKYKDLIDSVKKNIAGLSSSAQPNTPAIAAKKPPVSNGIVGYFGNAYVNPALLSKEQPQM
jgi:hypothetical protein